MYRKHLKRLLAGTSLLLCISACSEDNNESPAHNHAFKVQTDSLEHARGVATGLEKSQQQQQQIDNR